ncbi:peptidylprolyl isomerase [Brevundimonas sp. 2R-24]|uniref:Parvulin-like PPIase n=1 Tax=Peiella sedimenti TaxID=3061083 RepID=A0ABT8SIH7_9CAUL|nr:peptidylprolyl isomerase [Caulobacteraceae bacterium XZ-24]
MRNAASIALAVIVAGTSMAPVAAQSMGQTPAGVPSQAPAPPPQFDLREGVVATVNDQLITSFDLRQRMLMVMSETQIQPTEQNLAAIQQRALNQLIDLRLQAQEIAQYPQVIPSDEEVNEQLQQMAAGNGGDVDAMLAFYQQAGIQPATIRERIRVETGWRRLVQGRYAPRARVSQEQVDAALARITAAAQRPQYLLGEIYLDAAQVGGQQTAMNGATQLVQEILRGAPFPAVARQFSAAPTAAAGGDAGWMIEGEIQPEIETVLQQMEPGQLSRPIPVQGGVWIVYLRDKRTGGVSTFASLKQAAIRLPADAPQAEVARAAQTLETLRPTLTCDNITTVAAQTPGVLATDLGESDVGDLLPAFQAIARNQEIGAISEPVRTQLGLHLVAVCNRRQGGAAIPSRDEVEGELFSQQLGMLERRYLRDLRASATVETP